MVAREPVGWAEAVGDLRASILRGGAGNAAWRLIRVGRTDGGGLGSRLRRTFEAVGPRRGVGGKYCGDANDEHKREYGDAGTLHVASLGLWHGVSFAAAD